MLMFVIFHPVTGGGLIRNVLRGGEESLQLENLLDLLRSVVLDSNPDK